MQMSGFFCSTAVIFLSFRRNVTTSFSEHVFRFGRCRMRSVPVVVPATRLSQGFAGAGWVGAPKL